MDWLPMQSERLCFLVRREPLGLRPTCVRNRLTLFPNLTKDCRLNHIENDMFSNVSWDMLLTLYVEEMATGGPVLTKAVILGAGCAQSTGSRWIGHLEEQGLIRRFGASEDQRARMVEITDQGVEIMDDYLEAAGAVIYEAWIDMQVESAVELDSMH